MSWKPAVLKAQRFRCQSDKNKRLAANEYSHGLFIYSLAVRFTPPQFLFCNHLFLSTSEELKKDDDIFQNLFDIKQNLFDLFSTHDLQFFLTSTSCFPIRINILFSAFLRFNLLAEIKLKQSHQNPNLFHLCRRHVFMGNDTRTNL